MLEEINHYFLGYMDIASAINPSIRAPDLSANRLLNSHSMVIKMGYVLFKRAENMINSFTT